MTALGIDVVTLAFPNPDISGGIDTDDFIQVDSDISFTWTESGTIRTLSTTDASAGTDITGLLYTPVPDNQLCPQWPQFANTNASKVILPRANFGFVALAPWISPNCTLAYLSAVQQDPIRSFLFYLPGNTTDEPPLANDPTWGLNDGGKWKSSNKFPVYAVPSASGNQIMSQLALYAGNLTSVPNGHELANEFPPSDYVRLAIQIDTGVGSNLPSLWVFLLIVLGILIAIICSTSFMMHCIQRRRRDTLRRRVANGEIDIEALGIKRLTVPQVILDTMPLHAYASDVPVTDADGVETMSTQQATEGSEATLKEMAVTTKPKGYSQPTCAICLDDFVSKETVVRELPCGHIFHSECIDPFLRENSSLCPMCKKSVLPKGYCPAVITNAMVRRERMVRRRRSRSGRHSPDDGTEGEENAPSGTNRRRAMTLPRIRNAGVTGGRRVFSALSRSFVPALAQSDADVEMRSTPPPAANTATPNSANITRPPAAHAHDTSPPVPPCNDDSPPATAGTERISPRQRALAMMRRGRGAQVESIEEEDRRRPRWRKIVGSVWPGVA